MAKFAWKSRDEQAAEARAEALAPLRDRRDRALRESDWTQLPDAPLTGAERAAWAKYRQTLRDLPDQAADPAEARLPEPPA